jgi:hypothetical protein
VIGSTKVRPKLDLTFNDTQPVGIFMQFYNLKVDETTHKNNALVEVEILQGDKSVAQFKQTSAEMSQTGEQMTLEKILAAGSLPPGKYRLQIKVADALSSQTLSRTADFTVIVTEGQKAAAQTSTGR